MPLLLRYALAALILFGAGDLRAQSVLYTDHVETSLAMESTPRPGGTTWIAVHQKLAPHWHTYWINPGDSGLPTTIRWTLPQGVAAGAVLWPVPTRFSIGPIVNYGYSDDLVLLVPLHYAADAEMGAIAADVDWLVCDEICVPEQAHLTLDPASAMPEPQLFAAARAHLPQDFKGEIRAAANAEEFRLELPARAVVKGAYFFPEDADVIDNAAPQILTHQGDHVLLRVKRPAHAPALHAVSGILDLGEGGAWRVASLPVESLPVAAPRSGAIEALLFAFLGGLILNLMPCVLPILSMKALTLANARGAARHLRRDALFYLAGVLASFSVFAFALLAFKAGGEAVGWGFQLQSPVVVLALAVLMAAIGLNLAGVFELPLALAGLGEDLTRRRGSQGAFFTGVLAALVASPCTAPFMGVSLGYALTAPMAASFGVFLGLGLGFAAPFVAIAVLPGALRWIPKPGPWMIHFKHFLAFPMFATAIWLIWVLDQQSGPDGAALALAAILTFAFLSWLLPLLRGLLRWGFAIASIAIVSVFAIALQTRPSPSAASALWQSWSPEAVASARAEGHPVLVDFTAAWCVTCLVNERVVLDQPEVRAEMKRFDVLALKGDWTRRDPAISDELEKFGRAGVPLYLVYPAQANRDALVLPQILTASSVIDALEKAGSSTVGLQAR